MNEDRSRQRLGRGLASLIGPNRAVAARGPSPDAAPVPGERVVALSRLLPNPRNPRRSFDAADLADLAASIRAHGVVQPILVRPSRTRDGDFEIVAGERRWRAAEAAGLREAPVVVREIGDRESLEIAIIENVQRSDLNAVEEAMAYEMLLAEHGYTQTDLADVLGKSRSHVANTLRLLKLPEAVRRMVASGELSAGHARAAISVKNPEGFARRVAERGLSVRETEDLARRDIGDNLTRRARRTPATSPRPAAVPKNPDTAALEALLSERLGMRVEIALPGEGGSLRIEYGTVERLDALCRLLREGGEAMPLEPAGPRVRSL